MVWALSEINSNVETDGKVFPVVFCFALDLGFNILPEHLLFFVGVCCGVFLTSCILMKLFSSKDFRAIMSELKFIQIEIVNSHFVFDFIVITPIFSKHFIFSYFQSVYKGSFFTFDDLRIAYSFILAKCLLMRKENEEKWAGKENKTEKQALLNVKKENLRRWLNDFCLETERAVVKWEARGEGCHRVWGFHPQLCVGCYAAELHWKHWMVPLYSFSKVVGYEIQSEVFLMSVLSLSCSSSQETTSTVCH